MEAITQGWTTMRRRLIGAVALALLAQPVLAQAPVAGDWTGHVGDGATALRLNLHLAAQGGLLSGTFDSIDQGVMGLPLANVEARDGRLSFDLPLAHGRYVGGWDAGAKAYVGTWSQAGQTTPLTLVAGAAAAPAPATLTPARFDYVPAAPARARVGPFLPVGRCINLSNTLEAPTEGAWGRPARDDDFPFIAKAGFTTVRLPVRWSAHAAKASPYAIDPAFMARVAHVVKMATDSRLNVILNVHNFDELTADPAGQAERFAALWRQIGARFAQAPDNVWFELINEPHDKLDDNNLGAVLAPALAAARERNPRRPVLIGGGNWSGLGSLATLVLPDDPYVVPTFHYYHPFEFTHQGATWVEHPPPFGRRWGSVEDKALLDQDLAKVGAYMARTGRVPVMGEFGAQDDPRVPIEDRARYYGAVSAAFASVGVQGCAWGYASGFRLRDQAGWLPGLASAIVTTK
jgi:endoglucanase